MERKLASVQQIAEIKEIVGADAIEAVRINGWWVVAKKNEYQVNDLVVYCEVDSWIPTTVAQFLTKPEHFPKEYNGVQGERLKTVRLRGQLSQGLVLPISTVNNDDWHNQYVCSPEVGFDVTEFLGIQKWEAPESAGMNSQAKGSFPSFLRKTDQERVQNLIGDIAQRKGETFEVTIKIDGSSLTAYHYNGETGVCSRNINLKEVEGNAFWDIVKKEQIIDKIVSTGRNLAIQGELVAPNIQANHEKVTKPEFHCFSVFDIDKQEYLLPAERVELCKRLNIPHVPVVDSNFVLDHTVDQLLEMAEGDGMNKGVKREGLVFKSNTSQFSFKAISNSYLLKKG
jgi:RNA ligase (TIGR02306 family)